MYNKGIFVKRNGVWVEVKNPQIKQSSTWLPIKKSFVNIAGHWKQFWPSSDTVKFSASGPATFTVPYGIHLINISAAGGSGGNGGNYSGYVGSLGTVGKLITGQLAVNPGDIITVNVAAGGAPGQSNGTAGSGGSGYSQGGGGGQGYQNNAGGGGGGGSTSVAFNGTTTIIAAGGYGGGGSGTQSNGQGTQYPGDGGYSSGNGNGQSGASPTQGGGSYYEVPYTLDDFARDNNLSPVVVNAVAVTYNNLLRRSPEISGLQYWASAWTGSNFSLPGAIVNSAIQEGSGADYENATGTLLPYNTGFYGGQIYDAPPVTYYEPPPPPIGAGGGGGGGGQVGGQGGNTPGDYTGAYAGQLGSCLVPSGFTVGNDSLGVTGRTPTPGSNGYVTISW